MTPRSIATIGVALCLLGGGRAQSQAPPPCRDMAAARRALARWCEDPSARMEPYPYGWSVARTKRVACRALLRDMRRCRARAHRSEDGRELDVETPFRERVATDFVARLRRDGRRWRVQYVAVMEDCTGP